MRIGTDVAPDWEPKHMGIELLFPNEPDIPSAKNALQNILTRSFLHKRWWHNDPDCLLVRESSNLTLAEVQTLASIIAISGGLMLLSDDMSKVSRLRLRIAQSMLPLLPDRPWVIDWADKLTPTKVRQDIHNDAGDYYLLSFTNWSDKLIHKYIDLSSYFLNKENKWIARSFWEEKITLIEDGKYNIDIPAHGTVLFAVKPFDSEKPIYLGGDLHISQGIELSKWHETEDGVDFKLTLPRVMDGVVDLYLPKPARAFTDDGDLSLTEIKENCYRIEVSVRDNLDIHIRYK
jgi:alpha-galactosidase